MRKDGFGMGSTMAGADIYISYRTPNGSLYVGNYIGSGPVMPTLRPHSAVTSVKEVRTED